MPPFQVEAPRAGDAIGEALRDAYDEEDRLPDDMASLLSQLDRAGSHDRQQSN